MVYACQAAPSERNYATINDSPDAINFSWEVTTTPIDVEGYRAVAQITVDSTKVKPENLKKLEDKLYGTEDEEASLPLPDEVLSILSTGVISLKSAMPVQTVAKNSK